LQRLVLRLQQRRRARRRLRGRLVLLLGRRQQLTPLLHQPQRARHLFNRQLLQADLESSICRHVLLPQLPQLLCQMLQLQQ
jgi:hypothetical protein